jgi:hypothetical protein
MRGRGSHQANRIMTQHRHKSTPWPMIVRWVKPDQEPKFKPQIALNSTLHKIDFQVISSWEIQYS